jgi:hypothetical protein
LAADHALASCTVKRTDDGRINHKERAIADRTEGHGLMALLILLAVASVVASIAILAAQARS